MRFGQYAGELVTRVPYQYLIHGISQRSTGQVVLKDLTKARFSEVARAEIERRGERIPDVDVSAHAIDRASFVGMKCWRRTRNKREGIYAWAQRMTLEALDAYVVRKTRGTIDEERGVIVIDHEDLKWVIMINLAIPVLKTIKKGDR